MKNFIKSLLAAKNAETLIESGEAETINVVYPFSKFGYDTATATAWLLSDVGLVVTIHKTVASKIYRLGLHTCSIDNLDFSNPLVKGETRVLHAAEHMVIALLNFDVPKYMTKHFSDATIDTTGLISAPVRGKEYSLMWAQSDKSLELFNTTSQFEVNPNYSYNVEKFCSGIAFYGILDRKLINVGPVMSRDTEMAEEDFIKMTRVASTFKHLVDSCSVVPGMKVSANGFVYYAARLTKNAVECLDAADLEYVYFDRTSNKMAVLDNVVEN